MGGLRSWEFVSCARFCSCGHCSDNCILLPTHIAHTISITIFRRTSDCHLISIGMYTQDACYMYTDDMIRKETAKHASKMNSF
jgi:hypothetical protein